MGQILSEINAYKYGDQSSSYQKSQTTLRTPQQAQVAILSVVGAFREGKSFLLNFFVHYLESRGSGPNFRKRLALANNNNAWNMEWFNSETALNKFHWNSGTELDTHGILMWNQPFILKDENGEEKAILLMDTQGTFDHSSSLKQCTNIFALSTMLASVQIFNVSRNIQEDDLQNLELFTEFAKLARHSGDTAPFQTLLFLVRDWPNSNQYEYGFSGGQRFLDEVLDGQKDTRNRQCNSGSRSYGRPTSLIPAENMEVRTHLRSSFSELRCFLMPYPGLKVSNNNTQTKVGELEPDFKKELMLFVPSVLNDLQSKLLNGSEIDCAQFFALFKATIDASHQGALEKAKDVYNKETNVDYSIFSSVEFDKLHTGAKQRRAHVAQSIKERENLAREKREQEGKNSAEREQLQKIAEEQAREKERLRQLREYEERRAAAERRRLEEEARRQREEAERQRLAREAEQRRLEQERRDLEAEKRRQREEAERERRAMAEARRCAAQMSYSYAPSFGYSSPSYSGSSSSSSNAYWDPSGGRGHSGRWRDASTGRFTKNPYG